MTMTPQGERDGLRTWSTDLARSHPESATRLVVNPDADTQNAWDVLVSAVGRLEAQQLVLNEGGRAGQIALAKISVPILLPEVIGELTGQRGHFIGSVRLPDRAGKQPGWMVLREYDIAPDTKNYSTHVVCLREDGLFYAVTGHYDMAYDDAVQDFADRIIAS